jgi:hypothetical protein
LETLADRVARLVARVDALEDRLTDASSSTIDDPSEGGPTRRFPSRSPAETAAVLAGEEMTLRSRIAALEEAFNGDEISRSDRSLEESLAQAFAYQESGMSAAAGNTFLALLRRHPESADAPEVLRQAREAFVLAGDPKAVLVQEEIMDRYPNDDRTEQLITLARCYQSCGDQVAAARISREAADSVSDPVKKREALLLWATCRGSVEGKEGLVSAYTEIEALALEARHHQLAVEVRQILDSSFSVP